MSEIVMAEVGIFLLGGIFTVLWFLLRQKDAKQGDEIALLFKKHDEDAKRLQELELDIARRHYVKDELDSRFDRLENSIRESMRELGAEIRSLWNHKNGAERDGH